LASGAAGTLYLGQPNELQPNRTQTLGGDGSIQGSVVLGQFGRLEPGTAPGDTGTLTVSGSVTLGDTTVMELSTTGGAANDQLTAASIVYSGTLVLTNVGDITGTNTFQLFSGALSQNFANVITQSLAGVTWDLSQLTVNGSVTLTGPASVGPDPTPTEIAVSLANGELTLSWPETHLGWRLQVQTNSLGVGLSDNWVDVDGSAEDTSVTVPVGDEEQAVFYRMILP
jgi:hypothetical protein